MRFNGGPNPDSRQGHVCSTWNNKFPAENLFHVEHIWSQVDAPVYSCVAGKGRILLIAQKQSAPRERLATRA